MRPLTDGSRFARRALAGDVVALVAFLAIGLERHAENVASRFLSLVAIFVLSWLATAFAVGTYRPPTSGRLALTLVFAVPLAVAIRAAIVHAWGTDQVLTFMAVALVFCGALVALVRLVVIFVERRPT
jgi:Protein of unknown function (DUF3054)